MLCLGYIKRPHPTRGELKPFQDILMEIFSHVDRTTLNPYPAHKYGGIIVVHTRPDGFLPMLVVSQEGKFCLHKSLPVGSHNRFPTTELLAHSHMLGVYIFQ